MFIKVIRLLTVLIILISLPVTIFAVPVTSGGDAGEELDIEEEIVLPAEATEQDPIEIIPPLPVRKPVPPKNEESKFTLNREPPKDRSHRRDMAQIPQGVCRTFTYNPRGGKPDMRWSYANVTSGCAYLAMMQEWNKVCAKLQPKNSVKNRGCRIAQGHISKKGSLGLSSHSSHTKGTCFDIRPLRQKKFANYPLTYKQKSTYSQNYTKKFLELAKKYGASPRLFNDPFIRNKKLSDYWAGHHNHVHFCLNPKSSKVKRACKNWTPDPKICPRAGGWAKMLKRRGIKR